MKESKLSINLAWSQSKDMVYDYKRMILLCKENGIAFIRIFLCSWAINALYNSKHLSLLLKVIKLAQTNGIEVCLVMTNFVDYNRYNYNDVNNEKYSWINNPYHDNYKMPRDFFQTVDCDFFKRFSNILNELTIYSNVRYIEIMNEIDQVECSDRILINWVNVLISELKELFDDRYVYTCSISNHSLFSKYRRKLDCYVDLHFYSFPYENAIENIEYVKGKQKVLYLGEYAKFSDSDYLYDINSKIYFTSGLWGTFLYNLNYSPLHWWWEQTLLNGDYIKIIRIYNTISKEIKNITSVEIIKLKYKILCEKRKKSNQEVKKVIDRIINLINHPLFIFYEWKSIRKFANKKMRNQECAIARRIKLNNGEIYYLECRSAIILETDFNKSIVINLLSGEKGKYNKKFSKGNYLIF